MAATEGATKPRTEGATESITRGYVSNIPRSRHFWFFMASLGVGGLSSTMLGPFIPVFLYEELGISVGAVSFVYFIGGLVQTGSVFALGWLLDRFGRRIIFAIAASGPAIIPLALTRVATFRQVFPVITVSSLMDVMRWTSQTAIIADQVDESKRNAAYGINRIVINAAWIGAPVLGGFLLSLGGGGFHRLFMLSSLVGLAGLLLFLGLVPESRRTGLERPRVPRLSVLKNRDLLVLCVASMFSMLMYVQFYILLPIFASQVKGLSGIEVGALFSVSGATVVALQFPTSSYLERLPKQTGYILGVVIMATGITALALAPTFYWLLVAVVIMTVGENMFFPISSAIVAEIAPEAERGTYVGAYSLFLSIGGNLSPLLGGTVWQVTGNAYLPWLLSPLYAGISVALVLFFRLRRSIRE